MHCHRVRGTHTLNTLWRGKNNEGLVKPIRAWQIIRQAGITQRQEVKLLKQEDIEYFKIYVSVMKERKNTTLEQGRI